MSSDHLLTAEEEQQPRRFRQLLASSSSTGDRAAAAASDSEHRIVDIYDGEGRCKLQDSISSIEDNNFANNQDDDYNTVTGMMFAVSAKEQNIAILSFEFEYSDTFNNQERELEVEIYTLQGIESSTGDFKQFASQPEKWILYGEGIAIPAEGATGGTSSNSPNSLLLAIVPRDDMKQRLMTIPSKQTRSFYLTLKSKHLIVRDKSNEGGEGEETTTSTLTTTDVENDLLEINKGFALNGYGFPNDLTQTLQDRSFQGVIHYQSIQDCINFDSSTTIKVPLAFFDNSKNNGDFNFVFEEAIETLMNYNPKLKVMIQLHNLYLESIQTEEVEERDDCSEFIQVKEEEGNDIVDVGEGCTIYNGILNYQHLESLPGRQLEFELLKSFESTYTKKSTTEDNNDGDEESSSSNLELYYAGNSSFRRKYNIILEGISNNVILNPLQRSYIEDVTMLFFMDDQNNNNNNNGNNIPYEIDAIGQIIDFSSNSESNNDDGDNDGGEDNEEGRLLLRRRQLVVERRAGLQQQQRRRHLEPDSIEFITLESSIAGMGPGDDEEQYFQYIENTFNNNLDLYRDLLVKQQYRPGPINDGTQNFGSIFGTLQSVSVVRPPPPKAQSSGGGSAANEDGLTTDDIQIIVCSILLPIATLFFAYRIYVDCYRVDGKDKIKQHKLGHNEAKEEAAMQGKLEETDRENALKNMDLFPKHSFVPPSPTEQSSSKTTKSSMLDSSTRSTTRSGRSVSPRRGSGISQSFTGGLFGSKKPEQASSRGRSRSPAARTTNRGRSRSPAATGRSRGRSFSPTQRRGRSPPSRPANNSDKGGLDDTSFRVPSKSSRECDLESSFRVPLKSGDRSGVPLKSGDGSSQKRQRREPTRGNLKKANTFGEVETVLRKKLSTIKEQGQQPQQPRGRPEPPSRNIGKAKSSDELGAFFSENNGKPRRQSFDSRSVGAPPPPKPSSNKTNGKAELDVFFQQDNGKSNRQPFSSRSVGDARGPPPPPKGKTGASSFPPPPPVKNKSKSKKNKKNSQDEESVKSGKSKKSSKSKKSGASPKTSNKKAPKPLPVLGENGSAPTKNAVESNGGTMESKTGKPRAGQKKPKKSKSADDIEPLPEMAKKGKKKKKVPPRKARSDAGVVLPASPKPYVPKKAGKPAPPPVRVGMTGPQARP